MNARIKESVTHATMSVHCYLGLTVYYPYIHPTYMHMYPYIYKHDELTVFISSLSRSDNSVENWSNQC